MNNNNFYLKQEGLKPLTGLNSSLSGVFDDDSDSEDDNKSEIGNDEDRKDVEVDMDTTSPLDVQIEQEKVSFNSG